MTRPPKHVAAPPPQSIPGSSGCSAAGPWWGAPPPLPQSVGSPTPPSIQIDEAPKGVQDCMRPFMSGPSDPGFWWGASPLRQEGMSSSTPIALDSDPQHWGMGSRPSNGFVSFLNNPLNPHQYQHFSSHSINDHVKGTPSESQTLINLDSPKKNCNSTRTDKRLPWQKEEETNLVSAWLENSTDPINGNCKKTDRYWGDVTNAYNSTIPANRARTSKQLKDHFQKIKKKVGWFCAAWKDANLVYASGQSDDQLWDKAQKMCEQDYPDGPFMMKHCWLLLRDKPKWHAILEDKKRKVDGEGEVGEDMPSAAAQSEDRPMGTKRAKEERNGKGKAKGVSTAHGRYPPAAYQNPRHT